MENHLGRHLSSDEEVDHIDRDKTNDTIQNLQILNKSEHRKKDTQHVILIDIPCAWCKKNIQKSPRVLRTQARQGSAGPFCGASCRGKYGAYIARGGKAFDTQPVIKSRYKYKD